MHNPVIVPGKAKGGAGCALSVPLPDILQRSLIVLLVKAGQMSHSSIVEPETDSEMLYFFKLRIHSHASLVFKNCNLSLLQFSSG